ncbi:MAG: hypothetical protein K6G92_07590 [Bacteroidaceae bacterium]|nr:hypothetical protein [Bacteroidaceae bacterium]
MKKILLGIILLNLLFSCVQRTANNNGQADSILSNTESVDTLSETRINDFYTYTCADGHKRVFGDMCRICDGYEAGHVLIAREDNQDSILYVHLRYQRYHYEPEDSDYYAYIGSIPDLSHYTVSRDKKSLYVVTRVHANSNGWVTEYQLFKVDCETLEAKFICECAAIAVTDKGFTIAVARIINEDTATCSADEIWVMHDEYLDWNGNVTSVSKQEYDGADMESKYLQSEYTYIKGFTEITHSGE